MKAKISWNKLYMAGPFPPLMLTLAAVVLSTV